MTIFFEKYFIGKLKTQLDSFLFKKEKSQITHIMNENIFMNVRESNEFEFKKNNNLSNVTQTSFGRYTIQTKSKTRPSRKLLFTNFSNYFQNSFKEFRRF